MDRRVQENGFGRWIGMVLLVWIDFVIGLETGANGLLFRKDAEALLEFKNGVTGDPMGVLKGWILNNDGKVGNPCDWSGVSCSQWRVTMVDLGNAGLSGNLWAGKILSGLDKLDSLVLRGNNFTGDLGSKQKLGSACSVSTLDLSDNSLSGNFAMDFFSVCQSLVSLNISHNYLTTASMAVGRGAVSFGPSIQVLDISHNLLSDDSLLSGIITNCQNLKHLDLSYNRINGSLPPGIGQCTQLVSLNLSSNLFTDGIPTDLIVSSRNTKCSAGNCSIGSSLQVLDLSNNNLSGPLSALQLGDLCANLTVLNLSSNALTGKIPPSLGNCKDLKLLNLSANLLFGTIPAALGDLNSIEQLLIFKNKLNGNIPPELGKICPTLKELDLSSNNNISGPIPSSFALCSSLDTINLSNNQLFGNFLGDLLGNLHSLRVLLLSYNNLTGSIPLSLANCSRLEVLDLSSNNISGTIPPDICTPSSSLQRLFLPNNFLTGSLPPELVKCRNLRTIDFSFNYLNGTIPAILGSLPYLQDLVIWLNQLEGPIPDKICDSGSLETLILNNNFLTGEVPSSLMKCPNLGWISLSSNRLSGNIPSSLGHLDKLAILQLGNNSLSGAIPPELGNCSSLIWLDLNSNMLNGSIPPELSQQSGHIVAGNVAGKLFAFVRNEGGTACRGAGGLLEFAGIRPEQLSRSPMLHSCDFTRVYLGTTMYRFTDNGTLIYFDLSYNSLSGTIPEGIGSLYYVTVFNLGHNLITGTIPSSLGGLKQVGVLDLSHNMLHGFIPGSLGGLSFLSDFDVSNNNLTGPIPSSGQFMTFPSSRYENNSGLCGLPLPACGSNEGSTDGEGSAVPSPGHRARRNGALAGSVAMGLLLALSCILGLIVIAVKTKKQKNQEDMRDKYMDSLPTSGSGSWKLSGVLEPLSINVATFEKPLRKLTFAHLLEATNGFSADSLIGSGGFGDVYKAQLKDGSIVAIKKLIHVSGQGDREFTAEMETIGKIKHRNLVPLLGYCKIGEERLLVYEYMKWGSLETVLHEKIRGSTALDWATRKKVAIGSARGLAFLHHSCIPHIIHRDMKSSNVLLDENMEARVSDFGMARLMNALDTHLSVSTLAGTPGYVPPEYYQSFRCTTKGDVYSYGVILLELLSGRRPIDPVEFGDNNLVGWMKQHVKLKRASDVFDPVLIQDRHIEQDMYQHLRIACECLDDRPWRRPTMIQVLAMFRELQTDGEAELDGFTLPEDVDIHEETSS